MPELLTYVKFYSKEQSEELTLFVQDNDIPFFLEEDFGLLDKIYVGDTLDPMISLKIYDTDFEKLNNLIADKFIIDTKKISKDYYLLSFSNSELSDVINMPAEWNYFDRALASTILKERGSKMCGKKISISENSEYFPERISKLWLIAEYLLSVVFAYAGIIIGAATMAGYKSLGNGKKVPMFDTYTRNHALIIFAIGIVRSLVIAVQPFIENFID